MHLFVLSWQCIHEKNQAERVAIYSSNGDFLLMSTCAKMLFKKQKINRNAELPQKHKHGENRIKPHPATVVGIHLDFYYSE